MAKVVLYLCRVCKRALKFSNEDDWKYYEAGDLAAETESAAKAGIKVRLGVCPHCG